MKEEIVTFYPASTEAWRKWLIDNHDIEQAVWLIKYKKKANIPTISWSESVDEALCFGWIDGTARPIDEEKFMQYFCRRKPKSNWSKINKQKVNHLIAQGLMMPAGLKSIATAKQNGSWSMLDEVEELIVPEVLEEAFERDPILKNYYLGLSKSAQKNILLKLMLAKTSTTKQKRIAELAVLAQEALRTKV